MTPNPLLPLVAIVGPTASGKSSLAVWLAQRLAGEVIACDSTQLYRGFDIGTAKPGASERQGIPHHLIDVLEAAQEATAGEYRERAELVLAGLRSRHRLPIFTVGTGLYWRALLLGLAELPQRSEALRERLRSSAAEHAPGHLHRMLARLDPKSAAWIDAADEKKLIRAIEVCILARKPLSDVHREGRNPLQGWKPIKIGLAPGRDALYARVHARTDSMLANGWIDEVTKLVESGLPTDAKPFDFIGYRELRSVLKKEISLQEARAAIQQATRRYAKRQITWFRKEEGVHWLEGFGDDPDVRQKSLQFIHAQLQALQLAETGMDV